MELSNLKYKIFLVFCAVSIILIGMTLLWLSHHEPFTNNRVNPLFHVAEGHQTPVSLRLPSGHMVTPESLSLPESSSDLLITVKTAGSSGKSRLSLAFLTWLQTIDPKHVSYTFPFYLFIFLVYACNMHAWHAIQRATKNHLCNIMHLYS